MKKVLLSTVALIAFAAPAAAADLAARPYVKAPLPDRRRVRLERFYIGANGGWGQSHNCVDFITLAEQSQAVAVIVPEALSAGRSGIAGKPISSCSDWKHKAIGPTSATRASACLIRHSQPE
jgi:hypothetical protein